ncbi:hypothetical protein DFH06DRAFT_1140293 [Mycena polygramma]|nr:hypothetical protein DFH06DRAFT_1140293 [Mycena polygramma]
MPVDLSRAPRIRTRSHPCPTRSQTDTTDTPSHSYATRSRDPPSPSKPPRSPNAIKRGVRSSPSKPRPVAQSPEKARVRRNEGEKGNIQCDDAVELLSPALQRRTRLIEVNLALIQLQREKEHLTAQFQYSVLTLPVEITSEIFRHAVFLPPLGAGPPTSMVVSQVCRQWRVIALADPILWSVLPLWINGQNLYNMRTMVQTFLARSSLYRSFITLRYAGNDDADTTSHAFYLFLCYMFHHCAPVVDHLDIEVGLCGDQVRLLRRPMPQLRHLTLWMDRVVTWDESNRVVMSANTVPHLHSVQLHRFTTSMNITLPWAQITILACDGIGYRDLRSILLQTPALARCAAIHDEALLHLEFLSFTLYNPEEDPYNSVFPIAAMESLPSLRVLQMPEIYLQHPSCDDLVKLVNTSRLEELLIIDRTCNWILLMPNPSWRRSVEEGRREDIRDAHGSEHERCTSNYISSLSPYPPGKLVRERRIMDHLEVGRTGAQWIVSLSGGRGEAKGGLVLQQIATACFEEEGATFGLVDGVQAQIMQRTGPRVSKRG